ncbi:Hypothetical protein NTJ_01648 [Nesidiocoris tenuis]|uniref:Uncharacterized protein n=1 Tax=Nesidiocoris tenuis TaxID=355587 RepID=A0ABN7A958_9HEMI|nr:Hypothetical protein NTJ_01648 [Nesidiocoris tenuis]
MFNRWLQSNYHIDNVMTDIGSKSMKLPKLDEGTIGELIAFLNEQTVHSPDLLVHGGVLKLIITILDQSANSHSYSPTEWQSMAPSLGSLIERIFACFSDESFLQTEAGKKVVQDMATKLLPIITDQLFGPENHLSSETLAKLLGLTFSNNLDFNVCEDLMSSFWVIFRPSSHAQKRAVLVAKPSLSWQLVEKLLSCGEFDFQSLLMETLMTFAMSCKGWREVLSSWFAPVSPTIAEAVSLLDARQYDYTLRQFLNVVNRSQQANCRIHSLPCLSVTSGSVKFEKPHGFEQLWADCSPRSGNIRLSVDGGTGILAIIDVKHSLVQKITCFVEPMDPNLREVERCRLCITLHPGLLLPLSPPISVLNLSIVFERSNPFLEAEEYFFKSNYRQVYQVVSSNCEASSPRSSKYSRHTCLSEASLSTIGKTPSILFCVSRSCVGLDNACQIVSSTPTKQAHHHRTADEETLDYCKKPSLRTASKYRVSACPIEWLTSCSTPERNAPIEENNNNDSLSVVIDGSSNPRQPALTRDLPFVTTHAAFDDDASTPKRNHAVINTDQKTGEIYNAGNDKSQVNGRIPTIASPGPVRAGNPSQTNVPQEPQQDFLNLQASSMVECIVEPVHSVDKAVGALQIASPPLNDDSIFHASPRCNGNPNAKNIDENPPTVDKTMKKSSDLKQYKHSIFGKTGRKEKGKSGEASIRKPATKNAILKKVFSDSGKKLAAKAQEPDPYVFDCQITDEPIGPLRKKNRLSQCTNSALNPEEATANGTADVHRLPPVCRLSGGPRKLFTPGRDDLVDIEPDLPLPSTMIPISFPFLSKRQRTKNKPSNPNGDPDFIAKPAGEKRGKKRSGKPARIRYGLRQSKKINYKESSSSASSNLIEPILSENLTAVADSKSTGNQCANNGNSIMAAVEPMEVEDPFTALINSISKPPPLVDSISAEESTNLQCPRSRKTAALPEDSQHVLQQPSHTANLARETAIRELPALGHTLRAKNDDGYFTLSAKLDDTCPDELTAGTQNSATPGTRACVQPEALHSDAGDVGHVPLGAHHGHHSSRTVSAQLALTDKELPNGLSTEGITTFATLISRLDELELLFEKITNQVEAYMEGQVQSGRQEAVAEIEARKREFVSLVKRERMDSDKIREEVRKISSSVTELEASCRKLESSLQLTVRTIEDIDIRTENECVAIGAVIKELSQAIRHTLDSSRLLIGIKTLFTY